MTPDHNDSVTIPDSLVHSSFFTKRTGEGAVCPEERGKHPVGKVIPLLMGQQVVESEYGLSVDLQEKLRKEGQSAPWMKIGRRIFYLRVEFDRWLEEQKVKAAAPVAGAPGAGAFDGGRWQCLR